MAFVQLVLEVGERGAETSRELRGAEVPVLRARQRAPPGRDGGRPRAVRRRLSLAHRVDRHDDARRRLVFHVFAALAEFERDLIRERTHAGLAAARAGGRRGGRRPVMSAEKVAVARTMYESREHTTAKIAEVLGVSRATLYHLAVERRA